MSIHDIALLMVGAGVGGVAVVFAAFKAGYERRSQEMERFHEGRRRL